MSDRTFLDLGPGNATSIQGKPISATEPTDGQVLKYNSTTGEYEPAADDNTGGGGGGGGATVSGSYLVASLDSGLTQERALTAGTGLRSTDGGANSTFTLSVNDGVVATLSGSTFTGAVVGASAFGFTGSMTRLASGAPFITAVAGNVVTVSTGSGGQIIFSGSGGPNQGAPKTAQFLTLAADSELTVERVFTPSTGLKATDGGAGAAYTLIVHDSVVATVSGSTFTGAVTAASNGGFTGSLTRLVGGAPFITAPAGNMITVTTGSNGQIILSGSGDGTGSGGGSPGGNSGTIQINASGSFSGSAQLYYDLVNNRLATGPQGIEVGNPAGTFGTVIKSSATTADRTATIPLTTTSDTFVMLAETQTLTSKTLTSPTINTPSFGSNNIITTGDLRGNKLITSGTLAVGGLIVGTTLPSDVQTYFSGTVGLTGSNVNTPATRKVLLIGGDAMVSGSVWEQRSTATAHKFEWMSSSVTTSTTPFAAFSWPIASGSQRVTVEATVCDLAGNYGNVSKIAHLRNTSGTALQLGNVGGNDNGSFSGSFDLSITVANNQGRLTLTGSSTTAKWTWELKGLAVLA